MLDNWRVRRVLVPSIKAYGGPSSQPRLYTFQDLVAIRVLIALRDLGADLIALGGVVEYVRSLEGISLTKPLARTFLITDGHEVLSVDGSASLASLLQSERAAFHVVLLHDLVHQAQREVRAVMSVAA